jgi:hypothetical protein
MPRVKNVRDALDKLRPELPALMGDQWPTVAQKLAALEKAVRAGGLAEVLFPSEVMSLFLPHESARIKLGALIQQLEGNIDRSEIVMAPDPVARDASELLVTRYTDITCPDRIPLHTARISLVVRLRVSPPELSAAMEALLVHVGSSVSMRVVAPDFECIGNAVQDVQIEREQDSLPAVFDLRPLREGDTRITIDFFQAGSPVGTASVPVRITSDSTSTRMAAHLGPSLRLTDDVAAPELVLIVDHESRYGQHELRYTLFRTADGAFREFTPVPLTGDVRTILGRYYDQIVALSVMQDPTAGTVLGKYVPLAPGEVDRRMRQLGQSLWNDLFPDDFKQLYARERAGWKDKSLLIVSDEPWIPWELVWPYGMDATAGGEPWRDDEPWCMRFGLTRWLRRDARGNGLGGAPARLRLGALACIAPDDAELPAAQRERAYLASWLAIHGLRDLSPAVATSSAIMALLEQGGLDWLHFAAHGTFHAATPDMDSAVWLQGSAAFTPQQMVGPEIEQHLLRNQTAFVLNACYAGQMGMALTGVGGWARQLVAKGAGLFVGPLWTVSDDGAITFARAFYAALGSGATVAESVRAARQAAHAQGDPTWLAYSVYAHPNARVVMRPSHEARAATPGDMPATPV